MILKALVINIVTKLPQKTYKQGFDIEKLNFGNLSIDSLPWVNQRGYDSLAIETHLHATPRYFIKGQAETTGFDLTNQNTPYLMIIKL